MRSHWIRHTDREKDRETEKRFMQGRYQLLTVHSVDGTQMKNEQGSLVG